ncbi:ComEC/Rec2 family competence protein [Agromyces sp. NPDC055658]
MPGLRLAAPACTAWAGAWLAVLSPDIGLDAGVVAGATWMAAVLALVVALRTRRPIAATALVCAAVAALVATSASGALGARSSSPLATAAAEREGIAVVVELTAAPRRLMTMWGPATDGGAATPAAASPSAVDGRGGAAAGIAGQTATGDAPRPRATASLRFEGRLVAVDGRATRAIPVSGVVEAVPAELQLGARLAFTGRATASPGAERAAFDLHADGDVVVEPPPPWLAWSGELRTRFADAASRLDGDGGSLVPGLAIGDTSAVGAELDDDMKASSLSHLTAVSGANCAIITAAAFAVAAAAGLRRGIRVLVALVALAAFVVLVTPESSVVRAAVMAVVVLAALAVGRPGGGVAALALAVVVLLVVDPWYARDYGFALSVCATAGLLLLAAPLSRALARVMPTPLAFVLGVPLAAQLACQPVLVLLDPAIAVYGVPANLLAAPAAPVGTIAGLIGCLLLPVLPSVGFAAMQLAWWPAQWIAVVAHTGASLPGGRLAWLPDAAGAVLLGVCTVLALRLVMGPPLSRRGRVSIASLLVVTVAITVGLAGGAPLVARATRPAQWDVAACDVGQGDAVLVRSSTSVALIDTGPDAAALTRCLELFGVDRLDLVVLTHWDADHVGGTPAILGRAGTVLHGPLDGDRSSRVLEPLVVSGARAVEVTAGVHGTLGVSSWRVLWPQPEAQPGNDASVVLDLVSPGYRGVFLGDLGEESQDRMLRSATIGDVDLVKVAHHGSSDQSDRLYERLHAAIGLVGVGADNGYGHPTERALDLLELAGTTALRTDEMGSIAVDATAGGFAVWSERAGGVGGRP